MGLAMEILLGNVTAPGTTKTALTMADTDSLQIRNFRNGNKAWLLNCWNRLQDDGILNIRSPRLANNVFGIGLDNGSSYQGILLPKGSMQEVQSQDTLVVTQSGSAVALDVESTAMLMYYEDIDGVSANLQSWDSIRPQIKNILTIRNTVTAGVAGGYSGSESIITDQDQLKANTLYAILGGTSDSALGGITWKGADFGNLRVGVPIVSSDLDKSNQFFIDLSKATGLPTIPVFNSANDGGVILEVINNENASTPIINTILAELGPA